MKAMILAAGEGTRLRPLTRTVPKPMIPIVGTPLLARMLTWLATQGVTEAAVNLYHRPQSIPDFFGKSYAGIRLHYFFEDVLRGTAGGLKAAERLFRDAAFFVIYGDNLIHADLRRLADFHNSNDGDATVALFHHPHPSAAGIVGTEEDGRITRFVEKPPPDQVFSDLANAGIYVLNPSLLDAIPESVPVDFGKDIFPDLLAQGKSLYGTLLGGYLQDTGTPDAYRQANWDLLAGKVGVAYENPNQWVGEDTVLGEAVALQGRNILGNGVQVGAGASLTDCIVWDSVTIGAGACLERAILGKNVMVGPSAIVPPGTILGESESFG